jgi:bifunctional ADP-heptose synthase (sugar kinase/adenylyltransferase)
VDRNPFYQRLEREVPEYDLVVVTDYGHGLLDQTAMDIIQDKANFLCLNCQTNSTNYGANPITKYRRADTFTVDERELRLAMADNKTDSAALLDTLARRFGGKVSWATLGSAGSIAYGEDNTLVRTPALTLTVQDTVGAGDAFFALASLAAYQGVPLPVSSFIGNVAGALAANILGNSKSVGKSAFLKFAATLLKF